MRRRSRVTPLTAVNYWPGYVDALTNVVLNLLFLIAMFGIALSVLNAEARAPGASGKSGAGEAAKGLAQTGQAVADGSVPGSGELVAVLLPQNEGAAGSAQRGALPGPAPLVLATGPGGVRSLAPGSTGAGAAPVPIVGTGPNDPAERGAKGPGPAIGERLVMNSPSSVQLAGAGRTARATDADQRTGPGQLGGGYPFSPFAGVSASKLDFAVVDAHQRRFVPGVRLVPRVAAGGGMLVTINLAVGSEPVAALQQSAFGSSLQASFGSSIRPAQSRVRLWTATRLADPALRRTAYLALIETRNQLLALGFPAGSIEIRLVEGANGSRDEKQIYVLAVPASAN